MKISLVGLRLSTHSGGESLRFRAESHFHTTLCISRGYSTDYLIDFSIVTDSKNSSSRVIDIDQVRSRKSVCE